MDLVARLEKAGIPFLGETPVPLGDSGNHFVLVQDPALVGKGAGGDGAGEDEGGLRRPAGLGQPALVEGGHRHQSVAADQGFLVQELG